MADPTLVQGLAVWADESSIEFEARVDAGTEAEPETLWRVAREAIHAEELGHDVSPIGTRFKYRLPIAVQFTWPDGRIGVVEGWWLCEPGWRWTECTLHAIGACIVRVGREVVR